MKFDKDKFINTAEKLGIQVELNSENPGIFYVDSKGNKKELKIEDIFSELNEVDK